jgi:hypothetical protein
VKLSIETAMTGVGAPLMVAWELTREGKEKGKERRGKGGRLGRGKPGGHGGRRHGQAQLLRESVLCCCLVASGLCARRKEAGRKKKERRKEKKEKKGKKYAKNFKFGNF